MQAVASWPFDLNGPLITIMTVFGHYDVIKNHEKGTLSLPDEQPKDSLEWVPLLISSESSSV